MANIPQMSLKQATLQGGSFTPIEYKPIGEDISILQRSLAQIEARKEKAYAQQAAFNEVATKLETLVNPNEQQWVHDYIADKSTKFKQSIDSGDYGDAIRQAMLSGSELLKDPQAVGRIKAQAKFEEEDKIQKTRVQNKQISEDTYEWWVSNNGYHYEDIKDKNGNIIGGTDYKPSFRPEDDINFAELSATAYQLCTPDKNTTNVFGNRSSSIEGEQWDASTPVRHDNGLETYTVIENGKPVTKTRVRVGANQYVDYTYKNNKSYEIVDINRIRAVTKELISTKQNGYAQVEQSYKVAIYGLEKLQKQYNKLILENPDSDEAKSLKQMIDKRKELLYDNGSKIGYEEYYARMLCENLVQQNLAKDWRTSETGVSLNKKQYSAGSGSGTGENGTTPQQETVVSGAKVEDSNTPYNPGSFDNSVNGVNSMDWEIPMKLPGTK